MKRIYHPYWLWEDYKNGMYDVEKEYSELEEEYLSKEVKDFLSNEKEFYKIGIKVISEWEKSAEHNLTNPSRNKQAWLGQSSCSYKLKVPERITKIGWRLLSIDEQNKANKIADKIYNEWVKLYAKKISKQKCITSY